MAGEAIRSLSMDGRMTVCKMTIEAAARAGWWRRTRTTFAYLEGRAFVLHARGAKSSRKRWIGGSCCQR